MFKWGSKPIGYNLLDSFLPALLATTGISIFYFVFNFFVFYHLRLISLRFSQPKLPVPERPLRLFQL